MAAFCSAPDADLGLVRSLLGSVDCNVQSLAEAGYGALASPGSPLAQAMTILLTLYIGILGLRLMLGLQALRVGSITMTVLKIGLILALATNWVTYQQLVFDTLVKGPEQLGSMILSAMNPPSGSLAANPFAGLQASYDELQRSAIFYGQRALPNTSPMMGGSGFAAMQLTVSSMLLLLQSLGILLAAKIVLAVLLALGPIAVAMMLFPATRGLFEGWLRAALAFAFLPLVVILSLVIHLDMLQPHLVRLVQLRALNLTDPGTPSAVMLLALIFSLVTACLMVAIGVMALGFRLPRARPEMSTGEPAAGSAVAPLAALNPAATDGDRPQRAAQIAAAAAAMDRRDSREQTAGLAYSPRAAMAGGVQTAQWVARDASAGLRRSAQPRRAASSQRRDR